MDSLRRASLASAALLLGGAAACAEGLDAHFEEPTPEREPTAVPISFEVTVREASARGWPMRDARCVVEVDGLALAEQRSDVEGRVVFELPTWEAELALTCAKRHATSWVGLRRDELSREQFVIHVREDAPRLDAVRIMGAIHGPDEPGESFLVQSSRQVGRSYEGAEPSFVVETERGVPFALLALRYRFPEVSEPNHYALDVLGWTATRHRGTDGGALIDVDFDRELEPMVVQGSLGLSRSERPDRPLDGPTTWGLLQVYPKDRYGTVLLGLATDTFYSERGRLHYTAQSFEGFYADDEVLTQFVVADKVAGGPYSVLLLEGYPPMGQLHHRFLEPPLVLEPKARVPLEGAVLRWAPDEVQANVFVVEDASGGSLWVNWADERSELVVPTLPFRWRPLSEGTLRGRLLRVEEGALEGFYERVAASKELRFSP